MAEGEKGLKFGKLRAWTDTETQEAIDYIKSHNPALWRDVEQIEKTTGEFTDTAAFEDEYRLLMKLHPEICQVHRINLFVYVDENAPA